MTSIQLDEAKAGFSRYLDLVTRGETILVYDGDKAVAEMRPPAPQEGVPRTTPRPIGLAEGTFSVPSSFFEPLPPDLLAAFEGEG